MPSSRSLVNFIVVGAQKSGTTALDYAMREHPEITLPNTKELHFFDRPHWFFALPAPFRKYVYHRKFPKAILTGIRGEITPSYLYWRPTAARIFNYNPDVRIIAILREPVARAYSHYSMERARAREPLPTFEEAIRAELNTIAKKPTRQDRVRSYLQRSLYAPQIERFREYFSSDQILFLRFCDWRSRPNVVLHKISLFLGISAFSVKKVPEVFSGRYSPINSDTRYRLTEYFRTDIDQTEKLTGLDLSAWRS